MPSTGKLFVVGTPIGNLGDITYRGVEVLGKVDVIACEDTRRTRKLLGAYGVKKKLVSLHARSGEARLGEVISMLLDGRDVAYVTDAGMPTLSDPGRELMAAAREAGVEVEVIPGVSALTTILAYAPFPSARFAYEGFLPRKGSERKRRFTEIAAREHSSVIFESPKRIIRTLLELKDACGGERMVLIGRELTKIHEQVECFKLSEVETVALPELGEFSLVVEGRGDAGGIGDEDLEHWEKAIVKLGEAGLSRRDIIKVLRVLKPEAARKLRGMVQKLNDRRESKK